MSAGMPLWELSARLFAAALAGAIVGLHFEYRERPGGLRTHLLTSFAAALFCVTASRLVGGDASEIARALQGIASGVGFIGAASVLRVGGQVEGVANAASLWIAAAIGCEAGAGEPAVALGIAVVEQVLVAGLFRFERRVLRRHTDSGSKGQRDEAS